MTDRPQPPYFDSTKQIWILTRYADVLAALQHPDLWPLGSEPRDEMGRIAQRGEVLARFSQSVLSQWRPLMEAEALRILQSLPTDRTVDLFREFALTYGLTIALLANGADAADRERKLAGGVERRRGCGGYSQLGS